MDQKTAIQKSTIPAESPMQVHLSDYLDILKRRKWIVILFFTLIVTLVSVVSLTMTPVYRATAQIIIEGQSSPLKDLDANPASLKTDPDYYQTQYNLLRSRSLVSEVLKDFNLAAQFKRPTTSDAIKIASAEPVPLSVPRPSADTALIDWYLAHLQIIPVRSARLVNISFTGSDRQLITRIANAHAQTAVNLALEKKRNAAKQALDWIRNHLESQGAEVERLQRKIYEYKKTNDIILLEGRQNAVHQNLVELNSTLNKAKAQRLEKQAVYRQLKSLPDIKNLLTLPEVSRDEVIQNLRCQLVDLKAKQLELATSYYGPKHPKMIEIDKGIRQLQQDIRNEIGRLKKTIRGAMDRALNYEKSLEKSIDTQKRQAISLDEKAIHYDVMKKKVENGQKLYEFLLKQAETASLVKSENTSAINIVDPAETPLYPIKPRILLNILLAIVLGSFMGTGLAFFVEYMDNTLKTPEDVFRRLQLPVLAVVPHQDVVKTGKNLALTWDRLRGVGPKKEQPADLSQNLSPKISNQFPAALPQIGNSDRGQVIMVESTTMGEGKTTVLSGMAANFAASGLRTLMLDCDFQRPSLNPPDNEDSKGLADILTEISSIRLTSGQLSECSIGDIFFLLSHQRKNGLLYVTNAGQKMVASFNKGRLTGLQNQSSAVYSRLGSMLIKGNFITRQQLDDTLKRQQRTGQSIGYILVNSGYVTRDKLRGPIKLQTEENLQQLFSWKNGKFFLNLTPKDAYGREKIGFGENYDPLIEAMTDLEGSKLLDDMLFSHLIACTGHNLFLIPAGKASNGARYLASQKLLKKVLNTLKQHFDVILIDQPPLDAVAGTPSLSNLVDSIVLVVKAGHLSSKSIQQAIARITHDKILGVVLNQAKNQKPYYYTP